MKLLNCKLLALALLAATTVLTCAQSIYTPYAFTNFVGLPGVVGSADGNGSAARFKNPTGVAVDSAGNVYVADQSNDIIRKSDPAGNVTTLAGSAGQVGSLDGNGSAARFNLPAGVAVDSVGNVYVTDELNHTIRKIDTAGNVTTLAGSVGVPGSADGTGGAAQFNYPTGVAVDTNGNVYVADQFNHTIRKITPAGVVTTLAGNPGQLGSTDGNGNAAQFYYPNGVAADSAGNVYVADAFNNTIRKIDTVGNVTTLAGSPGQVGSVDANGSAARFNLPVNVAVDTNGNAYVVDYNSDTIRKIDTAGNVTTLAGSPGLVGSADGSGSSARFKNPIGVAVDGAGNVYVADYLNFRITKGIVAPPMMVSATRAYLDPTLVSVVFNQPLVAVTATNLSNYSINASGTISGATLNSDGMTLVLTTSPLFNNVTHILTVNNVRGASGLTIANNSQITILMPGQTSSQSIYTSYAFTNFVGMPGVVGSADGNGGGALFKNPTGVAVDSAGNVYVADQSNDTIRKSDPAGNVTTLAGSAGQVGSLDGNGSAARFNLPAGVAVDSVGNVYVTDELNHTIRKIDTAGNVTTLAGSVGVPGGADGTGGAAQFNYPTGVAVDTNGNVYVADQFNHTIRKITPAGVVTTLAGNPGQLGSTDGNGGAAQFYYPNGVAADSAGNVYVADAFNNTIRKIDTVGNVTTLAGSPGQVGSVDANGSAARFNNPANVTVDTNGNVYVVDYNSDTIRKIDTAGNVTTLAGSPGLVGSADGIGSAARFRGPIGVAVDGAGNVYVADSLNIRITKGTIVPLTVVSAARDYLQATKVSVVFNQPLVAVTATNLSNYTLNNGGTISGATLNLDGTVVLTTSPLSNNLTHILTVNNVRGASGLTIANNSQITVSVPGDTIRAQHNLSGTNSLLVLEAEHYNLNSAGGGSSWIFTIAPPLLAPTDANTNFSGDGAMLAVPDIGLNIGSPALGSVPANSPRLDFTVQFTNTGTFYVQVRGVGDSAPGLSTNDSVFIGLDNALTTGITGFPLGQGYAWSSSPAGNSGSIVVSTPGFHLINVWMREDGFVVDKILLTSDSGFTPANLGPLESPVSTSVIGPVITVTRSGTDLILSWPGGGTLQSSTNVVGSYVDIPGSSSPFNVTPVGAQKYYRVRR